MKIKFFCVWGLGMVFWCQGLRSCRLVPHVWLQWPRPVWSNLEGAEASRCSVLPDRWGTHPQRRCGLAWGIASRTARHSVCRCVVLRCVAAGRIRIVCIRTGARSAFVHFLSEEAARDAVTARHCIIEGVWGGCVCGAGGSSAKR